MIAIQRVLNILFILVLAGVLLGGYGYQFVEQAEPCPLCLLQRLAMIGTAVALLMNLRFGIRMHHYGLALLSSLLGRVVSLRQISLHVCPEFPTFGKPIFGLDLYVWSFLVFTAANLAIAILLILYGFYRTKQTSPQWGFAENFCFGSICLLTLANMITSFIDCGLSACG